MTPNCKPQTLSTPSPQTASEPLHRRHWLRRTTAWCVGGAVWGGPLGVVAAPASVLTPASASEPKTLAQLAQSLGAQSLAASTQVRLTTLDYAENGAAVPVDMATSLPGVDRWVLWVEKNPTPLIAVLHLSDAVENLVTLHTKMAQTSDVVAMAITRDGRALYARKEVKVVLGSCGSTSDTPEGAEHRRSTEATRIRGQIKGESALVRMRMAHEMESGQRKNAAGKPVPAWHIDHVDVQHNGQSVLTADWGPGVSRNPYLQLTLKKARVGEKITVAWRDNKGLSRSDDMLLV